MEFLLEYLTPVNIATVVSILLGLIAARGWFNNRKLFKELQDVAQAYARGKRERSEKGRDLSRDEYRDIFDEVGDVVEASGFVSAKKDE